MRLFISALSLLIVASRVAGDARFVIDDALPRPIVTRANFTARRAASFVPDASASVARFSSFDVADETLLSGADGNNFAGAFLFAWANHLEIQFSPEDVLLFLTQRVATHIDDDPEAARKYFVRHEGREEINVVLGTEDWALFIHLVGEQLQLRTIPGSIDAFVPSFSTTTPIDSLVAHAQIMSVMKHFFSYRFTILCGIPAVTLLGTRDDWIKLDAQYQIIKAAYPPLTAWFVKNFDPIFAMWLRLALGLEVAGDAAQQIFWRDVVSSTRVQHGCGGPPDYYLDGWLGVLAGANRGETTSKLGATLRHAPVKLDLFGVQIDTTLTSGFVAIKLDEEAQAVRPVRGTYVVAKAAQTCEYDREDIGEYDRGDLGACRRDERAEWLAALAEIHARNALANEGPIEGGAEAFYGGEL